MHLLDCGIRSSIESNVFGKINVEIENYWPLIRKTIVCMPHNSILSLKFYSDFRNFQK